MCGIYAEIVVKGVAITADEVVKRLDTMTHRGPDGWGTFYWSFETGVLPAPESGATIALAHRRLSIIDLSKGGAQPMTSACGCYAITFNGEIYNHVELREELRAAGSSFKTGSDTEVLLKAWAKWGPDCVKRFDGMFAFVVLDMPAQKLYAVRDFFGIKPLLYRAAPSGGLRFASETGALLDGAPQGVSSALFRFLRWGAIDDDEQTFFDGVSQLPPASWMIVDLATGARTIERYWRPSEERLPARPDESNEAFRATFLSAVDRHLRADVPVVATLSGGLDSSAICSAIRHLRPSEPITAFSYVADGPASEEKWIDIVASEKQLSVKKIRIDESAAIDNLERLVRAQGQPFGSGSIYAQFCIFEAIRASGYKVMLDGQGADEILAGYKAFLATRVRDLVLRGQLAAAAKLLSSHVSRDKSSAVAVALRTARLFLPGFCVSAARRLAGRQLDVSFLSASWLRVRGVDPRADEAAQIADASDLEAVMSSARERTILPALLRYADRNAMAHSVENRVPFLSRPLVEAALSMPIERLISPDARTKAALRDSLSGILPDAIRDRHDKIGFRATEEAWMRARPDWFHAAVDRGCSLPFVEPEGLRRAAAAFMNGDDREGQMLFRLFVLAVWTDAFDVQWS